jgi:hypothetical protein
MAHDALTGINCNQRPELSDIKELYFNYHFNQFNITAKNKKINFLAENFIKMPYLTVKVLIYRLFKIKFDTSSFLKKQLAKRNLHKLLYEIQ